MVKLDKRYDVLAQFKSLYDGGLFDLLKAKLAGFEPITAEEKREWHYYSALVSYREKRYNETRAHKNALISLGDIRGWQLEATLAAYVDKNAANLREALEQLPAGDPKGVNAIVIMARQPNSPFTREDVYKQASLVGGETVDDANTLHNAGRFFIDKGQREDDRRTAVELLDMSIGIYDTLKIDHHRGAAWYWRSVALLRLDLAEAIESAKKSLEFWQSASDSNKENADYRESVARCGDLAGQSNGIEWRLSALQQR